MPMIDLGECQKCHGTLCISGQEVCCERCGTVVQGHELTRGLKERRVPEAPTIPRQQMTASLQERFDLLEKIVEQQGKRLAALEAAVGRGKKRLTEDQE